MTKVVWITRPKKSVAIAFSKLLLKFSNVNAAALKYTTLKPKKSPADKPIKVVLKISFLEINLNL